MAIHEAANADISARVAAADPELDAFARAGGAALYRTNCSQCHGAGAAGAPGYPNLLDDEWLWGGAEEDILTRHGIRDPDTRFSQMPDFGADDILPREEIEAVADYVLALGQGAPADHPGAQVFAANCAACHAEDGAGIREMGAPNLADAIWLYGGSRASVIAQAQRARHGAMPAWGDSLTDVDLNQLAHYVHSLGGGDSQGEGGGRA